MINKINNQVQLIGRAGNQPELKSFENGSKMVLLRIATNDMHKNQNGDKVTDTQWHTVIAWGKTAEHIFRSIKKGNQIAITGKLIHRSYEDRQGDKKFITEVIANEFLRMGKLAS